MNHEILIDKMEKDDNSDTELPQLVQRRRNRLNSSNSSARQHDGSKVEYSVQPEQLQNTSNMELNLLMSQEYIQSTLAQTQISNLISCTPQCPVVPISQYRPDAEARTTTTTNLQTLPTQRVQSHPSTVPDLVISQSGVDREGNNDLPIHDATGDGEVICTEDNDWQGQTGMIGIESRLINFIKYNFGERHTMILKQVVYLL